MLHIAVSYCLPYTLLFAPSSLMQNTAYTTKEPAILFSEKTQFKIVEILENATTATTFTAAVVALVVRGKENVAISISSPYNK